MKMLLTILVFSVSFQLLAQGQTGSAVKENNRRAHVPELMIVRTAPKLISIPTNSFCGDIPLLPIPVIGEAKCFKMDSIPQACECLEQESYLYRADQKNIKNSKYQNMKSQAFLESAMSQASAVGAVNKIHAVVGALYSGDEEYAKTVVHNLEHSNTPTLTKRVTNIFVSHDKKVDEVSTDYLDYTKKYESCIPFADFSVVNGLPKKAFIDVLSDPALTVEDFNGSLVGVDPKTKARRQTIKDFILFNPEWEIAFQMTDKKASFEAIKNIYKDVDAEKLYRNAGSSRERKDILQKIQNEKVKFLKEMKIGKNYSKNEKKKKKDLEKSIKLIIDKADSIEGNSDLVERVVSFKGHPSIEDCKLPNAHVYGCFATYTNYCNAISNNTNSLDPKEEMEIEKALETVANNNYAMDRYKEVTKRYCDKRLRIGDTSKINGTLPESMTFLEFKKGLCEEKSFSIKGEEREKVCKRNQYLMSLFANEVVDENLIAKDTDADFEREFLQLYSNVEVNTDSEVVHIIEDAVANKGGSSVSDTKKVYEKLKEKVAESNSGSKSVFTDLRPSSNEGGSFGMKKMVSDALAKVDLGVSPEAVKEKTTTQEVLNEANKVVEQVNQAHQQQSAASSGASLNPEIARQYSLPTHIPAGTPTAEVEVKKDIVNNHVKTLEERINHLAADKEARIEADRRKEISSLEKELAGLKEYSKSMEKMIEEKNNPSKSSNSSEKEVSASRQIASIPTIDDHGASYVPIANAVVPSKVYDDHFADTSFHNQIPLGQSAMINREIADSKGSNDALMSVYSNQAVKSILDKGEVGAGNFILMSSPIEITESNEAKLSKRELQVDQMVIDELRSHPEKLKNFFEERKIEHIGLLTLKSSTNSQVNYMVRRDDKGKLLVIPVNIARKSKLDDLKRTLQVQASF